MSYFKRYIGIEIGPKVIKSVIMKRTVRRWSLERTSKIENPVGRTYFLNETEIELMADSLSHIGGSCAKAIIGIPNRHIVFRNIRLPRLTKSELRETIHWESQEFSSVFNGEFVSDYHVVEQNNDYLRVFLAGAEKKFVQNYCRIAKKAGLNLFALDAHPLAIERSLGLFLREEIAAVVDVDRNGADLTVIEKGKISLVKHLTLNSITDTDNDNQGIAGETDTSQYFNTIADEWVKELDHFYQYYTLSSGDKMTGALHLIGEKDTILLFYDLLKEKLPFSVVMAASMQAGIITKMTQADYGEYLTAIGLAMGG